MISIYILTGVIILLLDYIYLSFIKDFFNTQIKLVQGSGIEVNYIGVILCYLFIIFGINYFIIKEKKGPIDAFLLGLVIYAVYETTNLALLKKWKLSTVIIDSLWGGILFAITTYIVYKLKKYIK